MRIIHPTTLKGCVWVLLALAGSVPAGEPSSTVTAAPIQLRLVAGAGTPDHWPVTTGVPFRDGQLPEENLGTLRLETDSGRAIPAQFEVRGHYPRSRNVRWLGIDFQLDPAVKEYRLVLDGKPGPAPPQPVHISQEQNVFVVTTGDLKAEVPRQGGMLRRVWLKDELILEQGPHDGNWLTTLEGNRHVEARDDRTSAQVERDGPLHATIRVDGRYVDAAGRPSCRWTARLHFYAGRPEIGITHTFTWIGRADQFKIRDLALSFGLPKPATVSAVDRSDETLGESVTRTLKPGEMLSLVQDQHWHWGHGENHFGILAGSRDNPQEIASGEKAGSWIAAGDGRHAVTLGLRELWQQFPKELRAEPERLTTYLWSSSGKAAPFDLSYEALERFWGPHMVEQLAQGTEAPMYLERRASPASNDPTGMAKTHDLLLILTRATAETEVGWDSVPTRSGRSPNLRRCADVAETFDTPPLVLPDPHWTFQSDVLGGLWPKDESRFPEWEKWIDQIWADIFRVSNDWGDYGFFSYGDSPHQTYNFRTGRAIASPWRYTQSAEYGIHKAAWLGWFRSGDRRFYDWAAAKTRFLNDLAMCHEDSSNRWRGSPGGGYGPMPWAQGPSGTRAPAEAKVTLFEFFIEHALYHYYQTGDRRSLNVAEEYATALRDTIFARPDWASNYVATMNDSKSRWYFQRIDDLAVCYEQFGDPWFYEKSVELARLAIDLDDSSGIVREVATGRERKSGSKHPSYIFYKAPNLLSYMRNLEGEEFQRAKNALVKLAEHQFRTQSVETRTIGPRMAAAYYFTKDGRYLDYGVQRLDEFRRWTLRGERTPAGYTTIPHRATAKDALIDAAHLMGALAESPGPAPGARAARLMKHLSWPAIEFVFVKEQGRALEIELSASAATFTSPAPPQGGGGNPWPASWLGEPIRYYAHHDAMGFFNSDLPLEYRRASIPAEAPAGEYRISVGREGEAYVFAANATRAVMVAPEGFCVGGGMLVAGARIAWGSGHDDRWYFQVPQDAGGFRIAGTAVERLVIRDPDGKTVALEATGGGVHRIAVPPVAAGRLWSIEAAGAADVVFSGIRPVFACRDAKTFFMPAETAVVNKEKLVPPATYAPQQQARPRGTRAESAPESPGRKPPRDAAKQRAKGPGSIEAPRPKRRPRPAGNSGPAPGSPAGAPPEPPRLQPRDQAGSATPPARDPSADGDAALRPGRRQAPASSPRKAEQFRVWNEEPEKLKTPAFAIADDLYHVGNSHFSSHLLVGKKELVLIDTPMAAQFDLLVQSIRSVGVDPAKITLIIHTHAHYDHYGATARMVKLSGARTAIGAKEIEGPLQQPHILEPGARGFYSRQGWSYEPFNIHMLLEHGQTIDIGGTVIHCHHTPGHTKGTMSYTFDVVMDGQRHTALLWGGPGLHMFKPNQTDDWTRTFAYLKTLKGDVPLGAHPFMNDTMGKYAKRQQGVKPDPFIDPDGWKKFLEKQEAEFQEILAKVSQQQKGNSK